MTTVLRAEVVIPQLGVNDEFAVVVEWLVEPGQEVHAGMRIATVETTKAAVELEAEAAGHLYPAVPPGAQVRVSDVVALILDAPDDETASRLIAERRPASTAPPTGKEPPTLQLTERARRLLETADVDRSMLPTDRVVRESDVRALMGGILASPPTGDPGRTVAIYGASQGGAALAEVLAAMGGYAIAGFLDDTPGLAGSRHAGLPVWPGGDLHALVDRGIGALATHIAVASFRLDLRERARTAGVTLLTAIHPRAHVAPTARLGAGVLVKAGAVIDTAARIGDCCIVDNGAVVPHDNVLGDGAHIAPNACMGGDCRIGQATLVGVGAVVSPRVSIGRNVVVAPGAVVVRDVPDHVVVEGSPARVVGTRR